MNPQRKAAISFIFGGLLPVLAFAVIEEKLGVIWGVIAGMVFSVGEMAWEWVTQRKVTTITWVTGLLILVLGGISLWASDGFWFKMQPALLEAAFCVMLIGSVLINRPFLLLAMEKGGQPVPPAVKAWVPGLTVRLGIFFGIHAGIATWAAISWSTRAWAILKGVGFTLSMVVYFFAEIAVLRAKLRRAPRALAVDEISTPQNR